MTELQKKINAILKKAPTAIQDVNTIGILRKIPLDSPQLSYMFGGGLTIGRMHRFRGPESSGKSTICNYLAGQLQKKLPAFLNKPNKKVIVYCDFERTFDKHHATENGLNCEKDYFVYLTPDDIETASDVLSELIKTDELAGIILDSDAAAPSRAQNVDPAGKASFGGSAKALAEMIRKINILDANYSTTLLWISQERVNMQPMSHLPAVTGGEAPKFYASTVNRITKKDVIKEGDETTGITIRVRNYKNKTGVPFRDANMNLYYRDSFRPDEEYIDFLIAFDIIKQSGAFFSIPGEEKKVQGRVKVQEWLNAHQKEYTKMKQQVDEMLVRENILDANRELISEDIDPSATEISEDIMNDDEE